MVSCSLVAIFDQIRCCGNLGKVAQRNQVGIALKRSTLPVGTGSRISCVGSILKLNTAPMLCANSYQIGYRNKIKSIRGSGRIKQELFR